MPCSLSGLWSEAGRSDSPLDWQLGCESGLQEACRDPQGVVNNRVNFPNMRASAPDLGAEFDSREHLGLHGEPWSPGGGPRRL